MSSPAASPLPTPVRTTSAQKTGENDVRRGASPTLGCGEATPG